jgi:predicted amidohydrolase YtcJ
MRAAVERRTASGVELGSAEALTPEQALALFTTPPHAPGATPRRIAVGVAADLCLLDAPWSQVRLDLDARHVRASWCAGTRL